MLLFYWFCLNNWKKKKQVRCEKPGMTLVSKIVVRNKCEALFCVRNGQNQMPVLQDKIKIFAVHNYIGSNFQAS